MNCKHHADLTFHAGHDVIQDALARELQCLDLKLAMIRNSAKIVHNLPPPSMGIWPYVLWLMLL